MSQASPALRTILVLALSGLAAPLPADAAAGKSNVPRAPHAPFESDADATSFRSALAKAFGGDVVIDNPDVGSNAFGDEFGNAVALSGDTALIGVERDETPAGANAGSAYVFTRSAAGWSLQAQLVASDGATNYFFGHSVALEGDTAVVGANRDDNAGGVTAGAAYVFTRSGTVWSEQAKLLAGDGAAGDNFGTSVALSGDTVLVGVRFGNLTALGPDVGSAYVFTRSGAVWTQQTELNAGDGVALDDFGWSVALSGDTALIGARLDDVPAGPNNAGSAYVFKRVGALWTQQAKLFAANAANDDTFGWSVALSGDTALVGAIFDDTAGGEDAGSAYVYTRSGTSWNPQAQLIAADTDQNDSLGAAVALSGNIAVIGAWQADTDAAASTGAAYVFARNGSVWSQQVKLAAAGVGSFDYFGISVAVDGGIALVGALRDTTDNSGSVRVFTDAALLNGGGLVAAVETLIAPGDANDLAGTSVATTDDTFVVGSPDAGVGGKGEVYVFRRGTNGGVTVAGAAAKVLAGHGPAWVKGTDPVAVLTEANGTLGDKFGSSVAIAPDGETIVVGAPLSDSTGDVYLYRRPGAEWSSTSSGTELIPTVTGATLEGYGTAVAIDDTGVVAVGAPLTTAGAIDNAGAAYVFQDSGTTITQTAQLLPPAGAADAGFGSAVAVSDDVLAIGAPNEDEGGATDSGAAYLYTDSGTTTTRVTTGTLGDKFGTSVATLDGTVVVGAPGQDTSAGTDSGAATVYQSGGGGYVATSTLVPLDGTTLQSGVAVATNGDYILVGAPLGATSTRPASIYFYEVPEGNYPALYSPTATLTGSDAQGEDGFGSALAVSPRSLLLGLPLDDIDGSGVDQGTAERYIFDRIHRASFE